MNDNRSSLTITTIQAILQWEDRQANLQQFEDKINAIEEKTELVILPEMFSTGFSMNPEMFAENMNGPTVNWMRRIAGEKKIILTGSIIIEDDSRFYNRLIWMLPGGEYGYYDKRHRFAFAGEDKYYSSGSRRLIASAKGWKINLQICYDLRFPVWSRQSSPPPILHEMERGIGGEPEYDLLIYVANWPERRSHAWKILLQARAIENQCFVIGVNRVGNDGHDIYHSGDSMIVDPLGEVLYSSAHAEDVYTYTLKKEKLEEVRNKLPFLKDADNFVIGL
jgi:omega-amidase